MTEIALKRFVAKHEKHSAPVLDRMFDNAIVSGWKDLYELKPQDLEQLKSVTARSNATKSDLPPVGSMVEHPNWGVNTVRYYRQDGQMVLDECGALAWPHEVTPCPN